MSNGSLTLLHRTRLTWCYAGGPATSDARSPWFNDCLYIASNFWQWGPKKAGVTAPKKESPKFTTLLRDLSILMDAACDRTDELISSRGSSHSGSAYRLGAMFHRMRAGENHGSATVGAMSRLASADSRGSPSPSTRRAPRPMKSDWCTPRSLSGLSGSLPERQASRSPVPQRPGRRTLDAHRILLSLIATCEWTLG